MSRSTISRIRIKSLLRSKSQTNLLHNRLSSSSSDSSLSKKYVLTGILGSSLLAGGATVLYAKLDPAFRKKIGQQIPLAEDALTNILGPIEGSEKIPYKKPTGNVEESLLVKKLERSKQTLGASSIVNIEPPPLSPPLEIPKIKSDKKTPETKAIPTKTEGPSQNEKTSTAIKGSTSTSNEKETKSSSKDDTNILTSSPSTPFTRSDPSSSRIDQSNRVNQLETDFDRKLEFIREEYEKDLTKQLKRQLAAHLDHLKDQLEIQKIELERKRNLLEEDKLIALKEHYFVQLGNSLERLEEIERIFRARETLDKEELRARKLWLLCQHLNDSLKSSGLQEPRTIKTEILAVKKSLENFEGAEHLSVAILNNIPQEALEHGVYNEDTLIERFPKVDRLAKRLALVGDHGGSLGLYLLSYLQSTLVFDNNSIPEKELSGEIAVDPSKWDTFDVLCRVRYCLKQRNIEQALKYANQLKGASRKVATSWIKDLRTHLEVRQAADLIQARAASIAIRSVK